MADNYYGVDRPNWVSPTGLAQLTSRMEFITITTHVDIRAAVQSGGSLTSQAALNKLLEIVSERGQPVVMSAVTVNSGAYTLFLATEHLGWTAVEPASPSTAVVGGPRLIDRIVTDGVNYGFPADSSNLTVTIGGVLT